MLQTLTDFLQCPVSNQLSFFEEMDAALIF